MTTSPTGRYDASVTAPAKLADVTGPLFRELTLRVPENLGCLDGHFPDLPVVPGVVQIRWVIEAARPLLGGEAILERVEALKFKKILQPGDVFRLRVEVSVSADALNFRLWNEERLFSSGRWLVGRRRSAPG